MKRFTVCCYLLLMSLYLFTGCSEKVTLRQSAEEIVQIELIYSPFNQFDVLYTLSDEEIKECAEEILNLDLHRNSSPSGNGGTYIVKIVYSDGAIESLGSWSISYVSDGNTEHDGWYYISKDDLLQLFTRYIDPDQIPIP